MSRHPEPRRPPGLIPTPRRGGGERLLVRLDERVARDYRRAVAPLVPRIERSLGSGVLANRALGRGPDLRLASWGPAWARWLSITRAAARGHVVRADVASFYASVREPALRRTFGSDADAVLAVLRSLWDLGVTGLPIGPEPSAVVANAVLAEVDDAVARLGIRPHRWVDDWVIPVGSVRSAGRVLVEIERALSDLGLRANHDKTLVLPPWFDRSGTPPGSAPVRRPVR